MSNNYKIITASNIEQLVTLVNTEIDNNYSVIGGMSCEIYQGFPPIYHQTLLQNTIDIPTVWNMSNEPIDAKSTTFVSSETPKTKRKYTKNEDTPR